MMKLLLTDSGIKNASIQDALVDLLGKPITESNALCIPTAGYGAPDADPDGPWRFISGRSLSPMTELGWKSVGVLELTALPSIDTARWVSWVREADVLLVNGGDALYLCHWMRESGLAGLLPSLPDTVYVGLSAGSMVMTPRIGQDFVGWKPPTGGDSTLGLVDFSIFPHLDHPACPENTMAAAERWAARSRVRRTRSTSRPPSRWPTAPSKWSPRATGSCSTRPHEAFFRSGFVVQCWGGDSWSEENSLAEEFESRAAEHLPPLEQLDPIDTAKAALSWSQSPSDRASGWVRIERVTARADGGRGRPVGAWREESC
jgi:dipeptidase E